MTDVCITDFDLIGHEPNDRVPFTRRSSSAITTHVGFCRQGISLISEEVKSAPIIFVAKNDDTGEVIARGSEAEVREAVRQQIESVATPLWIVIGPERSTKENVSLPAIRGRIRFPH